MNFQEWQDRLAEICPDAQIVEQNGEIVVYTRQAVDATFDGRSSIPAAELEIHTLDEITNYSELPV